MTSAKPVSSPGPKGRWFFGNLPAFAQDPLGFLERCSREHGEFVRLQFLNRTVFLVNTPELVEEVLATRSRDFRKTIGYRTPFMRRLFGEGLLTSEGEHWTRQRRLAQPAFHKDRIASYGRLIAEIAERTLREWKAGQTRNVHEDMMRLTTEVVTKALFNSPVPKEIDQLGTASAVVMERFTTQWRGLRVLLNMLPSRSTLNYRRVMRSLDAFIYGLIRERRASGKDTGDLLSMLLAARDEDGSSMTDRQLRDELTTLMVAGLDTTALALSWSFYLLSQNPKAQARLSQEVRSTISQRPPALDDLPRLRYTEMVLKEAMRLYPPAWVIGREALRPVSVGGEQLRPGTAVIMSQWLAHRSPKYFPSPNEFQPERWEGATAEVLPRFAYYPFGGGPRVCIGSGFAMMEAMLVLAAVAQRFKLTSAPDYCVVPWPSITLQPRGGIFLSLASTDAESQELA